MARRVGDGKANELAASRTLNPRPEAVVDEGFRSAEFFDARDLVQVKYEMVRRVEADGLAVSAAAGGFGFSRQRITPRRGRCLTRVWPGWCQRSRGRAGRTS